MGAENPRRGFEETWGGGEREFTMHYDHQNDSTLHWGEGGRQMILDAALSLHFEGGEWGRG